MPQMIDLAEVEAAMEAFRLRDRSKAELPGLDGVVARAQLAALPVLTIWRVKELNRGTVPNEVLNALVMVMALTLAGEIMSLDADRAEQFKTANRLLLGLGEEIGSILTGRTDVPTHRHDRIEAGRA